MERKFDFVEVTLDQSDYDKVREVYRLHKEQAYKLFDLSSKINTDDRIMELVKDRIEDNIVLLAIDKDTGMYAGCITFRNMRVYNDRIIDAEVHPIICRRYWGPASRQIINDCYSFVEENWIPINRLTAKVPANNFGVIKLLKDVGFKIEGTCKNIYVFKDKDGNDKLYNQLIYSDINRHKEK